MEVDFFTPRTRNEFGFEDKREIERKGFFDPCSHCYKEVRHGGKRGRLQTVMQARHFPHIDHAYIIILSIFIDLSQGKERGGGYLFMRNLCGRYSTLYCERGLENL